MISPHVKVLIFDLSDVLIKGLEGSEIGISKELNLPKEQVFSELFEFDYSPFWLGKMSENECFEKLLLKTKWKLSLSKLKKIFHDNFYEIEGTRSLIMKLGKKYKLILLSVNSPEWSKYLQENFSYEHLFDSVYYSHQIGYTKRQPESFKYILDKHQLNPINVLLIDDSSRNINIAQTLGIEGIKFLSAQQLQEELLRRGFI